MSPSETTAVVNLKSSSSQLLQHKLTTVAQTQSCNTRWHLHNKLAAVAQEPYPSPYQSADPLFGISCIDMTLNLIKCQDCCTSNTVLRKSLDAGNAKVFDLLTALSADLFQHQHVDNHLLLKAIVASTQQLPIQLLPSTQQLPIQLLPSTQQLPIQLLPSTQQLPIQLLPQI
jgi:hypothetical protein